MDKNIIVQKIARTTWYPTFGPKGPRRMSSGSKKSGCGTLVLFVAILSIFGLVACNGNHNTTQESIPTEQASIDSLAVALREIDSIMNSGQLVHLDVYEIGKLKNTSVSVQKLTTGDESSVWINFRKDCGGEYYYSWEDAHLLNDECPYFIEALTTILSNKDREVDHEERYAYVTKDNIRILSSATSGKEWSIQFSVDYLKQNSTLTLSDKDAEDLEGLIQKAQSKIRKIM